MNNSSNNTFLTSLLFNGSAQLLNITSSALDHRSLGILITESPLVPSSSLANFNYPIEKSPTATLLQHLESLSPYLLNQTIINCTGKKAVTDLLITKILFTFLYLLIFLISAIGNSLVVYVVLTEKSMQTVTNIFIANLAISDLLVCCTSLWLTPVYTYIGHWIWGGWLCYGLPLFQGFYIQNIIYSLGTSIFISTLTLMSIALDRYFVICHHSKNIITFNEHMSMQFIAPFVIIGFSYVKIWLFLKSRRTLVTESEQESKRKKRLLKMLVTMVVLFAICWLPFNVLNVLRDFKRDAWIKPYFSFFFLVSHLISMTATAVNPVLYSWMNHAFRSEFIRVLPCLTWIFSKSIVEQSEYGTNRKTRIITDSAPASNRKNCSDAVRDRKLTLNSNCGVAGKRFSLASIRSSVSHNPLPDLSSGKFSTITLPSQSNRKNGFEHKPLILENRKLEAEKKYSAPANCTRNYLITPNDNF